MSEPTLTEMRELCEMMLGNIEHGDRIGAQDIAAVSHAFLSLTDPTPLTAEHCREAGLPMKNVGLDQRYSLNGTHAWKHHKCDEMSLDISEPTLGILRLALLQENRDGE